MNTLSAKNVMQQHQFRLQLHSVGAGRCRKDKPKPVGKQQTRMEHRVYYEGMFYLLIERLQHRHCYGVQ